MGSGAEPQLPEAVRRRGKFFEDRLGYPAISMNFKTELYICNTLNIEYIHVFNLNEIFLPFLKKRRRI